MEYVARLELNLQPSVRLTRGGGRRAARGLEPREQYYRLLAGDGLEDASFVLDKVKGELARLALQLLQLGGVALEQPLEPSVDLMKDAALLRAGNDAAPRGAGCAPFQLASGRLVQVEHTKVPLRAPLEIDQRHCAKLGSRRAAKGGRHGLEGGWGKGPASRDEREGQGGRSSKGGAEGGWGKGLASREGGARGRGTHHMDKSAENLSATPSLSSSLTRASSVAFPSSPWFCLAVAMSWRKPFCLIDWLENSLSRIVQPSCQKRKIILYMSIIVAHGSLSLGALPLGVLAFCKGSEAFCEAFCEALDPGTRARFRGSEGTLPRVRFSDRARPLPPPPLRCTCGETGAQEEEGRRGRQVSPEGEGSKYGGGVEARAVSTTDGGAARERRRRRGSGSGDGGVGRRSRQSSLGCGTAAGGGMVERLHMADLQPRHNFQGQLRHHAVRVCAHVARKGRLQLPTALPLLAVGKRR